MKKRPIDERLVRYAGPSEKIAMIAKYAEELGLKNIEDSVSFAEAFPGYQGNEARMALNGYRSREGSSQEKLAGPEVGTRKGCRQKTPFVGIPLAGILGGAL